MPDFRRGAAAIAQANESSRNRGDFKPFLPNIYWKDDQDERFVLILNPIEDIPMVLMQKVWTSEGRTESVIARTDDAIGEARDPLRDTWGYDPKETNVCIAVELDPEFEMVRGRKRPSGFVVKTRTFERRIRDAQGELTDEREEVTVPLIGVIAQSPANFFNHVASQDANKAPIETSPALIRRIGKGTDTDYEVELLDDKPLDLTNLIELIGDVSYLKEEEVEELLHELNSEDVTDEECGLVIGSVLLDKYLNEIAEREEYDRVFALVDTVARYPYKGFKKGKTEEQEEKEKPARATRTSQRRSRRKASEPAAGETAGAEEPAEAAEPDPEPTGAETPAEPEAEQTAEEKPARSQRRAKRSEAASEVSKSSPVRARMEELRAKAEAKAQAKAAEQAAA